jgi:TM2 domain-containing membrane protein YozV/RNA polymerase subunit RPABC4/transcription elongation factor Spt4
MATNNNYCPQCQTSLREEDKFCPKCGAAAQQVGVASEQQTQNAQATGAVFCNKCGFKLSAGDAFCPKCGADAPSGSATFAQPRQGPQAGYARQGNQYSPRKKERIVAGILAILLNGLGIHKFYLGKTGLGILYFVLCVLGLVFSWLFIPALISLTICIIAIIEGIVILVNSEEEFDRKYNPHLFR